MRVAQYATPPIQVDWEVPERIRKAASRVSTSLSRHWVEQALTRYDAGMSRAEIVAELPISRETLRDWIKVAGLPRTGARPPRVSDTHVEAVVTAYRQHGSIRGAARELGLAPTAVGYVLKRHAPDAIAAADQTAETRDLAGDPRLDHRPLKQILDSRIGRGWTITEIARDALVPERKINGIRRSEYETVRLSTADKICCALGLTLKLVYPEDEIAA